MADDENQIEAEIQAEQNARLKQRDVSTQRTDTNKASLTGGPSYDLDIYGGKSRFEGYDKSIQVGGRNDDHMDEDEEDRPTRMLDSYTAPKQFLQELADDAEDAEDPLLSALKAKEIQSRQSDYHNRRFDHKTQEEGSYKEAMRRAELEREEVRVLKKIKEQQDEKSDQMDVDHPERSKTPTMEEPPTPVSSTGRKKRRWDVADPSASTTSDDSSATTPSTGEWSTPTDLRLQLKKHDRGGIKLQHPELPMVQHLEGLDGTRLLS
ncbi:hypothetical protein H4Q26_004329 [Puccinia striiformis f. sp. tritici PST-130]|nr:hypothetical protein H4Q26_004329 [Puccinia striiformis f. sp. tritici PST-130]